jgi:hypothetical protein
MCCGDYFAKLASAAQSRLEAANARLDAEIAERERARRHFVTLRSWRPWASLPAAWLTISIIC